MAGSAPGMQGHQPPLPGRYQTIAAVLIGSPDDRAMNALATTVDTSHGEGATPQLTTTLEGEEAAALCNPPASCYVYQSP